jgi:hypothetical protein
MHGVSPSILSGLAFGSPVLAASPGGWNEKKGRRLSPAALPEEALFNVLSYVNTPLPGRRRG